MNSIPKKIESFYSLIKNYKEGAPDTRYKSWEWCHNAFIEEKRKSNHDIEYLSLHLAFYLASWGMYRGSSYLLQRDYKAHKKAVKIILDDKYNDLWDYKPNQSNIETANNLLFGAQDGIYWKIKESYKGYNNSSDDEPSDTLITKILMGTFGCIPAFDRFLKLGISRYNQHNSNSLSYKLTQKIETSKKIATDSFKALADFYIKNETEFKKAKATNYPPMKLVDMYFWQVGYEIDIAKNLRDENKSEDTKEKIFTKAENRGYCPKQSQPIDYNKAADEIESNNP